MTNSSPTLQLPRDRPLGRPAEFADKIVGRRIALVRSIEGFVGKVFDLVDIGCGNGASMFMLASGMSNCVGLEISEDHRSAFEAHKQLHAVHNCEFRLFDIETKTIEERFDRLISFEVIEHLRFERSVRFYYEVLKPGGLGAISVPNKWWIFETHGADLPLLPWNRVPFFSWLPRPIHERFAHARIYTKKRIIRLLESAGFEVLNTAYITAPMDVLPEGRLKSFLLKTVFRNDSTRIPLLATAIFVTVRKP